MENRKITVLIVLSVLAVGSLTYGILTPSKVRRELAKGREVEKPSQEVMDDLVLPQRRSKRSTYEGWGRNPFSESEVSSAGAFSNLRLSGIVWDPEDPQAVINERIVRVGHEIGGSQVVAIKETSVILKEGESYFELRLGRRK